MEEVRIDPEELQRMIRSVFREEISDLFGFKDEEEARKLLRHMGDTTRRNVEFIDNAIESGKQGVFAAFKQIIKILALAVFAWLVLNIIPQSWVPQLKSILK